MINIATNNNAIWSINEYESQGSFIITYLLLLHSKLINNYIM